MDTEEIIEMAKKSGCHIRNGHIYNQYIGSLDQMLKTFAKLVAEKERHECARICAESGMWNLVHEIEGRGQE